MIKSNDHIILDRGFRDVQNTLTTKYKLNVHMPSCVPPSQKQLITSEANQSRLATKCRWIVEEINDRFKSLFSANDKIHCNTTLKHTLDDLCISAALINKYFGNFGTSNKSELMIANRMKSKLNTVNRLENIFTAFSIDKKRKDFKKLDVDCIPNFPKLDLESICNNITMGPSQLKKLLAI
jgi:hypothetical protein